MHAIHHLYHSPLTDISRSCYKVIRTICCLYYPHANLAHTFMCMNIGMYVSVYIQTDMSHESTCMGANIHPLFLTLYEHVKSHDTSERGWDPLQAHFYV